ncbi:hypothetical protein AWB70_06256 [Caballeronia cordobensis]|uniref:Uncharacterized protein n=1 Tax=Caballeronia cordobensis TaxID=1353886 RepID=A0A158JBX1_CABCO|nr:hypothetical protein [Caballeronia cordobensis]SAL66185.1 hypothetical protein AWB70_06256 [Caballeronia cordobensis]
MTTKSKAAKVQSGEHNPHALELLGRIYSDPIKRSALLASNPVTRGAATGQKYALPMFGDDVDVTTYLAELHKQASAVLAGDMSGIETMLLTQANTLDMIFNQLARKAANVEYLSQFQAHLSLALKAQAQSRVTLEALAEIKNPRQVAFVRQANIAHGPQQVNNATDGSAPPDARARGKNGETTNGLLTDEATLSRERLEPSTSHHAFGQRSER